MLAIACERYSQIRQTPINTVLVNSDAQD